MTDDLQTAQQHWHQILKNLGGGAGMTRATFDFCLRGSQVIAVQADLYQVGVLNPLALDWLNGREGLRAAIIRELSSVTEGGQVSLEFASLPTATLPPVQTEETEGTGQQDGPSPSALAVAGANYHAGFFERGGAGFNQIPHHNVYFWQNLLGPAFDLWLILVAEDKRSLSYPAHWWTPPVDRKYIDLARKLNRRHHRYISGDEIECTRSREKRQEGQHLAAPSDCCHSSRYDLLRFKTHPRPDCGLMCLHWKVGLLEILARWNLIVVEVVNGLDAYKFKIQTWRMLPILTPAQVGLFDAPLQDDYRNWLRAYGGSFGISGVPFWEGITEDNLIPLMPTHDQPEINAMDLSQRRKRQDFLKHAVENPFYMREAQAEEDENSSMHG